MLQVETLDKSILQLVGVTENVTIVKADDRGEVLNPIGKAIDHVRFNRVFNFPAGEGPIKDGRAENIPGETGATADFVGKRSIWGENPVG